MGFDHNGIRFLLTAKEQGVDFSRPVTLGRQRMCVDARTLERLLRAHRMANPRAQGERLLTEAQGYGEGLLKFLGATEVASLDASDYEGATLRHDLNAALPEALRGRFSVVIDGGTLEHVFDFPRAIRNGMELVRPGGHFVTMAAANNLMGHGFYQFSPELFFRVFSAENGFRVERMILNEGTPYPSAWYAVLDPAEHHGRVTLCNWRTTFLNVQARKTAAAAIFATPPQQSDYSEAWKGQAALEASLACRVKERMRPWTPQVLIRAYHAALGLRPFAKPCYKRLK